MYHGHETKQLTYLRRVLDDVAATELRCWQRQVDRRGGDGCCCGVHVQVVTVSMRCCRRRLDGAEPIEIPARRRMLVRSGATDDVVERPGPSGAAVRFWLLFSSCTGLTGTSVGRRLPFDWLSCAMAEIKLRRVVCGWTEGFRFRVFESVATTASVVLFPGVCHKSKSVPNGRHVLCFRYETTAGQIKLELQTRLARHAIGDVLEGRLSADDLRGGL